MISYAPLWETMKRKNVTADTLAIEGEAHDLSVSTIKRLEANEPVSTATLNAICNILGCNIADVIEFVPNENKSN